MNVTGCHAGNCAGVVPMGNRIMTTENKADPKGPVNAVRKAKHACCEGESDVELQTGPAKTIEQNRGERTVPSEVNKSSCCCGTKDGQPST
jgi:hypothetical protein